MQTKVWGGLDSPGPSDHRPLIVSFQKFNPTKSAPAIPLFVANSPEYRTLMWTLFQEIPDSWHPTARLEAAKKVFVEQVGPARQQIKHRRARTRAENHHWTTHALRGVRYRKLFMCIAAFRTYPDPLPFFDVETETCNDLPQLYERARTFQ
eukprot:1898863-Pyramimonas_sp.AAC.1